MGPIYIFSLKGYMVDPTDQATRKMDAGLGEHHVLGFSDWCSMLKCQLFL